MGRRAQEKRAAKAAAKGRVELPTASSPWEVLLLGAPEDADGLDGLLVVAESSTGAPRLFAPLLGGSLQAAWAHAVSEPLPPCVPARPSRIRCADEATAEVLRVFGGAPVDVVGDVPAARAVMEHFMEALSDHPTELTTELPRWHTALDGFAGAEPQERWGSGAAFRFSGAPALDDAVAEIVLCDDGSVGPGIQLFLTAEEYDRALDPDEDDLDEDDALIDAWQVTLEREDERPDDEVADALAKGLRIRGRIPLVTGGTGDADTLSEAEQRVLLAALEGVVAAATTPDPLPDAVVADTVLGPLRVRVQVHPPLVSGPGRR